MSKQPINLHKLLAAAKNRKGLTNEEVHAALERYQFPAGVKAPSLAVVGHWLNGTRRPRNMEHLRALCDILDVDLDEAMKGPAKAAKTAEEQLMIETFRQLSPESRQHLLATGRLLASAPKT